MPQWRFGRTGQQLHPDRLVLDLDPGEGVGLAECAEVARLARAILTDMGLDPMPVTSGSKGIHLYAALDGKQTSDQVSEVAHELARALEADHPDLIVSDMKKTLRAGKVLVDWSQNNAAKTTITPYSLRGRAHPTVAVPRTWKELAAKDLAHLDYEQVMRRMKRRADPLAGLTAGHLAALEPTAEHMATFEVSPSGADRLARYRSMRDASKTPEPVPERAGPSGGRSFVIQEHHARRLHWDFRLERDGVLVSWALPKGVPTDVKANHLAVQTEDHPLEYGAFEGRIPRRGVRRRRGDDLGLRRVRAGEVARGRGGHRHPARRTGRRTRQADQGRADPHRRGGQGGAELADPPDEGPDSRREAASRGRRRPAPRG